jgi:hypothetical protein
MVRTNPDNESKKTNNQINLEGFEFANAITEKIIETTVRIKQMIPMMMYKAIIAIF